MGDDDARVTRIEAARSSQQRTDRLAAARRPMLEGSAPRIELFARHD